MRRLYPFILIFMLALGCASQVKLGAFGSAHEHADFKVYINGIPLNFSQEKYQSPLPPNGSDDSDCTNGTRLAHLHDGNGNVVHKHATGATWGYFFSTLNIALTDTCITIDNGSSYCNSGQEKWRYFVNGNEVSGIKDTEIQDLSRVLFTYGAGDAQIPWQLASVTNQSAHESTGPACGPEPAISSLNQSLNGSQKAIVAEYYHLASTALARNLTSADLALMGDLTASEADLHKEWGEALWLADRGFSHHVRHSLDAIFFIVTRGKFLCPSDSLAHVGVFLQYNETAMAADSLEDGQKSLPEWEQNALATRARNPQSYPGLEKLLSTMKQEISDYNAGNIAAAISESSFLEQNGYC